MAEPPPKNESTVELKERELEEVERRNVVFPGDGRQVHHAIFLFKEGVISAECFDDAFRQFDSVFLGALN
jgi:hypothetical protein